MTIARQILSISRTIESALSRAYVYCTALDHAGELDLYRFSDGSTLVRSQYGLSARH